MFLRNSVIRKRAFSRSAAFKYRKDANIHNLRTENSVRGNEDNHVHKERVHDKLDLLNEDDIDKVSRQIDEIIKIHDVNHNDKDRVNGEHRGDGEFYRDEYDEEAEELNDKVSDLPEPANYAENKSITELSEMGSKPRDIRSRSSRRSSKSYISKLRQELDNERSQRQKLESEIEELKRFSSEISSRLGLTPHRS
jgi:rubrerythrin